MNKLLSSQMPLGEKGNVAPNKLVHTLLLRNSTTNDSTQPRTIISSRMVNLRRTAETLIRSGQANGWLTRLEQEGG